ncbi:MAG: hypothetical protein J0L75_01765 [Spirochaetes bacterium]|nr:hypothetical protein [Spirochaetota bacterium]
MKPFTFYHLSLGALFVALLYFAIFSVLSLVEMGRLEKRVENLSTELNSLRGQNAELSRLLVLQSNLDASTVSLARHGWKKSNEILVSIEPPLVPEKAPKRSWLDRSSLWISLGVAFLLSLLLFWRFTRTPRRVPRVQVIPTKDEPPPKEPPTPPTTL